MNGGFEIKRKKAYYKRGGFMNPSKAGSKTIASLLRESLKILSDVQHREEQVISGGQQLRAISGARELHGMQAGRLLHYTPGQRASVLEHDEATGDYIVTAVAAPAGKKKTPEFVESIVYFAVRDNHVVFLSGMNHAARSLEKHLNWLFDAAGTQKTGDNYCTLSDQLKGDAQKALSAKGAHKIRVGSELEFEKLSSRAEVRDTKRRNIRFVGDAMDMLNNLLGPLFADEPISVPAQRAPRIDVDLQVTYRSKAKTSEGLAIMNRIALAARHFDEADCVIDLQGGGQLKGEDLRVFEFLNANVSKETGLVDENYTYRQMADWLTNLISTGTVPA